MSWRLIHVILVFAVTAACKARTTPSDAKVIGGRVANQGELPGVVLTRNSCTAAKITSRHLLTAGHCVMESGWISPRYSGGQFSAISLSDALIIEPDARQDVVEVKRTYVHPTYYTALNKQRSHDLARLADPLIADIAIIELAQDTPNIPLAKVSHHPVEATDKLVLSGYGCEHDKALSMQVSDRVRRLKTSDGPISIMANSDGKNQGSYWLTPVTKTNWLCQGDSGGPLMRALPGGGLEVVGVNSTAFKHVSEGAHHTHTRIDNESAHRIDLWIERVLNDKEPPSPIGPANEYIARTDAFEFNSSKPMSIRRNADGNRLVLSFPAATMCLTLSTTADVEHGVRIVELYEKGLPTYEEGDSKNKTFSVTTPLFRGYFGVEITAADNSSLGQVQVSLQREDDGKCRSASEGT